MSNDRMQQFISGMPKAELHLHLEGTLSPQMLLRLAERNEVAFPYPSVAAIEADKAAVEEAVTETLDWMMENREAETEELKAKQEALEAIVNPIVSKVYADSAGAEGGDFDPNDL